MKPTPLVPALPPPGRRRAWSLSASAGLHAAVVALLLLWAALRPPPEGGGPEPSFDLVFQGPSGTTAPPTDRPVSPKALPPAQPADIPPPPDAALGTPAPTPLTTPDPAATGSPPPGATTTPPAPPDPAPAPPAPVAAAPAPSPALAPAAPPPAAEALPDEPAELAKPVPSDAPPQPQAPAVRLEMPPTETTQAAPAPIMPELPPPLPPAEPPPRPTARRAPTAPRPQWGTLSNPMDLSLAPSAPRPAARGSVASRAIDLSPPPVRAGSSSDPYAKIRAANASADWNNGLESYWLKHRYYPEQAVENGEQGSVTLRLTVNRSGRVESVEVISRSGSPWLDMAAVSTWRGAQLPPFTADMREDRITFPIPIQYYLVRR